MGRRASAFAALIGAVVVVAAAEPASAQRDTAKDKAEIARRLDKVRNAVQTLSDRLRTELGAALKAGPPASAIAVCQTISPDLAAVVAEEASLEIIRTSLRVRNPENSPDEWEEKVLQLFQARSGSGNEIAKLEHSEIVTTPEGDRMLRYMKAIPVAEACLACHGTDVKQDVKAEIARLYPEDKALGYRLGELRGAFSVIQLLED